VSDSEAEVASLCDENEWQVRVKLEINALNLYGFFICFGVFSCFFMNFDSISIIKAFNGI